MPGAGLACLDCYSVSPHVLAREEVGDSGFWEEVGCGVSCKRIGARQECHCHVPFPREQAANGAVGWL